MLDASVIMLQQYSAAAALSMATPNAATSSTPGTSGPSTSAETPPQTNAESASAAQVTSTATTSSTPPATTTLTSDLTTSDESENNSDKLKSQLLDNLPGPSSSDNLSAEEQIRLKRLQKFERVSDQE